MCCNRRAEKEGHDEKHKEDDPLFIYDFLNGNIREMTLSIWVEAINPLFAKMLLEACVTVFENHKKGTFPHMRKNTKFSVPLSSKKEKTT